LGLKITINDGSSLAIYEFLIESIEETGIGQGFTVWGRSKQALLGEGQARPISDTKLNFYSSLSEMGHPWTGKNVLFSDIIEYIITNYCEIPVAVNLNIPDFPVKLGTLSVHDMYPIEIIKRLAEAVGAQLRPLPDGSLDIIEFKAPVATGDPRILPISFDGGVDIVSPTRDKIRQAKYDAVKIYGFNETNDSEDPEDDPSSPFSSLSISIHPNQEGNATAINEGHIVRIFNYKPGGDANRINFYARVDNVKMSIVSGAGAGTPPKLSIRRIAEPPTYESREITETISLTFGHGNTTLPDTSGRTEYHDATYDSDPFIDVEVTYTSVWTVWELKSDTAGTIKLFAAYPDGSADDRYSWDVVPIAKDYFYQVLRVIENSTLAPRPGVPVYIDSVLQGTTDENGEITSLDKLQVGSTHTVSWPAYDNIVASDADDEELQNDNFVAIDTGLA
jgi:hypothetical protein